MYYVCHNDSSTQIIAMTFSTFDREVSKQVSKSFIKIIALTYDRLTFTF